MTLIEQAKLLLDLEKDISVSGLFWEETKRTYLISLRQCDNAEELLQVLKLNSELRFPIDLMMATYEKTLEKIQTPELLREYASYLYLHGPDWDEYSLQLIEKANNLERQQTDMQ